MFVVESRVLRGSLAAIALFALASNNVAARELSLSEAVALTKARNPALGGFAHESAAVREDWRARNYAPPLTVDVELENFGGTGDISGVRGLETTLQISKVFEWGGKMRARAEVANAALDSVEAQQRVQRADLMAELARRFLQVLSNQEQLQIAKRATLLSEQTRVAVEARVREGAISTVYLNRAQIELARARIAEEHSEHELAASRVALATLWADTSAAFEKVAGNLFSFPAIQSFEAYAARLEGNPMLSQLASEQRVSEARVRLANAQRTPNVTLSAGIRRLEAFDDEAFVAGFSIPLGAARRADPSARSAQATSSHVQASIANRRLELYSLLFGLYQEITHAKTEASALRSTISPEAQRMVDTTLEGYRQGRYSLVDLQDSQQVLIGIERDALRAALEFHLNLIEIERLTGAGLDGIAPEVSP